MQDCRAARMALVRRALAEMDFATSEKTKATGADEASKTEGVVLGLMRISVPEIDTLLQARADAQQRAADRRRVLLLTAACALGASALGVIIAGAVRGRTRRAA